MFAFLRKVVASLRFISHRRERLAAANAAERQHQLSMLSQFTNMLENLVETQNKSHHETASALIEIAKASQAQAEAFSVWIKSFQTVDAPITSIVREEDELQAEYVRSLSDLGIDPSNADLPPEFRLALSLQRDFAADVAGDHKA